MIPPYRFPTAPYVATTRPATIDPRRSEWRSGFTVSQPEPPWFICAIALIGFAMGLAILLKV